MLNDSFYELRNRFHDNKTQKIQFIKIKRDDLLLGVRTQSIEPEKDLHTTFDLINDTCIIYKKKISVINHQFAQLKVGQRSE